MTVAVEKDDALGRTMVDRIGIPGGRLEVEFLATAVAFTWFGVNRALDDDQVAEAAKAFDADPEYLSGAKRLIDTNHPAYKRLVKIRGRIKKFWRRLTVQYPMAGVRLIRMRDVEKFEIAMADFSREMDLAAAQMGEVYGDLREEAAARLKNLFNPADYPEFIGGLFAVSWSFVSVQPPDYLAQLRPDLYRREADRVRGEFDQAARIAESAFVEEFGKLVGKLVERLTPDASGNRKILKEAPLKNLREFVERFRNLSVSDNRDLAKLVDDAENAIAGVKSADLREVGAFRKQVKADMSRISGEVETMMVDAPRRRVMRGRRPSAK